MKLSDRVLATALVASVVVASCSFLATANAVQTQSIAVSRTGFAAAKVMELSTSMGILQSLSTDARAAELAKMDLKTLDDLRGRVQTAISDMKLAGAESAHQSERVRNLIVVTTVVLAFAFSTSVLAARTLRRRDRAFLGRQP